MASIVPTIDTILNSKTAANQDTAPEHPNGKSLPLWQIQSLANAEISRRSGGSVLVGGQPVHVPPISAKDPDSFDFWIHQAYWISYKESWRKIEDYNFRGDRPLGFICRVRGLELCLYELGMRKRPILPFSEIKEAFSPIFWRRKFAWRAKIDEVEMVSREMVGQVMTRVGRVALCALGEALIYDLWPQSLDPNAEPFPDWPTMPGPLPEFGDIGDVNYKANGVAMPIIFNEVLNIPGIELGGFPLYAKAVRRLAEQLQSFPEVCYPEPPKPIAKPPTPVARNIGDEALDLGGESGEQLPNNSVAESKLAGTQRGYARPGRAGKKGVIAYLDPAVADQLKTVAESYGVTTRDYLTFIIEREVLRPLDDATRQALIESCVESVRAVRRRAADETAARRRAQLTAAKPD